MPSQATFYIEALRTSRPWAVLACTLCLLLWMQPGAWAASMPDFEEDISLDLDETQLRKMGARPCSEAALCLTVRWGERPWQTMLRLQGGKLAMVELRPDTAGDDGLTTKGLLDEFALFPVRVQAGEAQCDAFALVRAGKNPDNAMNACADLLDRVANAPQYSVWYVDEDELDAILSTGSLEKAGGSYGRTLAARLSVTPGSVEVGYGRLGNLLQPGLKP